jgi:transposase
MFIREKYSMNKAKTVVYKNYSIVDNVVINGKKQQITLYTLGSGFALEKSLWTPLTDRIESIIENKNVLFKAPDEIEVLAQELAPEIIKNYAEKYQQAANDTEPVTISGISRQIGIAYIALHAMEQLRFQNILEEIGFDEKRAKVVMALIVARMEYPTSEAGTFRWLANNSAIGELLGLDFSKKSPNVLHDVAQDLIENKESIERLLFPEKLNLFSSTPSILLYNLTNSHFIGSPDSEKAKRGHSKQKRSDCLLESIAIFVDENSYIRRTVFYPGNVSEQETLEKMLEIMNPPKNAPLIMDRGIATDANVKLMIKNKLKYLVASRKTKREFDESQPCIRHLTKSGQLIKMYSTNQVVKTEDGDFDEIWLHCHSDAREAKEVGMSQRKKKIFEDGITKINDTILKSKKPIPAAKIHEQIGALKKKSGVASHYKIEVKTKASEIGIPEFFATEVRLEFIPLGNSKMALPGVYVIRTNLLGLKDTEIWDKYTGLTGVESVFRALKSELGLRPNFHQKEDRIDCHYFISVLAYQCANFIRKKLLSKNIHYSWSTIVEIMSSHQMNTIFQKNNKGVVQTLRKPTLAEESHIEIYEALGIPWDTAFNKIPWHTDG